MISSQPEPRSRHERETATRLIGAFGRMKPFYFLGTRAEDDVADAEYEAVLRFSGLGRDQLRRVRLEAESLPRLEFDELSGFILGGGPFNVSDPDESKSPTQHRVEGELCELVARVVVADVPFLGACYGIGTLGILDGGLVDRTFGEPIGATSIRMTEAGRQDRLFGVLPAEFDAFLGHKEAVRTLPASAVLLASSRACPVQAFRIGRNVYATQFHPELDVRSICDRIDAYRDHGYFASAEQEGLKVAARGAVVTQPQRLLARFADLYARE